MATINELIEQKKISRAYDSPAKDIKDNLKKLTENIEVYQKRWFWELLQNACDFNEKVKIQLEIRRSENVLIYSHNGRPFKVSEAMNLIAPDTSKDKSEREGKNHVIGKFGTGFISTHVLSTHITVQGQIINETEENEKILFKFELNREAYDDREKLIDSMIQSEKDFIASHSNFTGESYSTLFIYNLNKSYSFINPEETINSGLIYISKVLPFVLAFNDAIEEIKIIDDSEEVVIKCTTTSLDESKNATLTHLVVTGYLSKFKEFEEFNNIKIWTSGNWHYTDNEDSPYSQIGCIIKENNIYNVKNLPKIYCDFPLIGSESFHLPVIVNSYQFIPTSDRDGISISSPDKTNVRILKLSVHGYKQLLAYIESNIDEIGDIYNVSFSATIANDTILADIYNSYWDNLLNSKLIKTKNGFTYVKECLFPYQGKLPSDSFKTFALLCSQFYGNTPAYEEALEWERCLPLNNSLFAKQRLTIDKLIKDLTSACKNIGDLESFIEVIPGRDWLKSLYQLLIEIEEIKYFNQENILLSETGEFIGKGNEVYLGDSYEDELIISYEKIFNNDILDHVVDSYFDKLMPRIPTVKTLTRKDLCKIIDQGLKQNADSRTETYYIESVVPILQFTSSLNEDEIYEYFPWFSLNRLSFVMSTLANPKDEGKYFSIYKSGKIDILAKLAVVPYSEEELAAITENPGLIKYLLKNMDVLNARLQNSTSQVGEPGVGYGVMIINDELFANPETGNIGEALVYEELRRLFNSPEHEVIWASKDEGQPAYDFRINYRKEVLLYVDAKTTTTAISQSDSIPFFLKKSQWDFIQSLDNKYWIARVFLGDNLPVIKFLKVSMILN